MENNIYVCVCVYIYMCITETICCTAEINTTLQINYTSIILIFLKKKLFTEGEGEDGLGIWDYQMQTLIYIGKDSSERSYKYEP